MVRYQEIINHILSKWGEEEEMRALNEQYRYTPPYPTLHLEDFLPEECLQNLYEEAVLNSVNNFISFSNNRLRSYKCLDED